MILADAAHGVQEVTCRPEVHNVVHNGHLTTLAVLVIVVIVVGALTS